MFIKQIKPASLARFFHPFFLKRHHNSIKFINNNASKTMCLINHFYDQDLKALSNFGKDYNFLIIEAPYFFRFAKYYFSEGVKRLRVPYPCISDKLTCKYKNVTARAVKSIIGDYNPVAIIVPSDVYYWIREFISCFSECGVPTFVLDKEGMISPAGFRETSERIRDNAPFMSDAIFTWSERQREYWEKIGVSQDRIHVVGQMRSDLFFQPDILEPPNQDLANFLETNSNKLITLLSFMDTAYIPDDFLSRGRSWRALKQESHQIFHRLALQNPDIKFIIKAHPQQADLEELHSNYTLPNLRVIGSADCTNFLIARSDLLIGFQTTTLFEALNHFKKVIYLGWDPLDDLLRDKLLPLRSLGAVTTANTPKNFLDILTGYISNNETITGRFAQLDPLAEQYLRRPDGRVAERFFSTIEEKYIGDAS